MDCCREGGYNNSRSCAVCTWMNKTCSSKTWQKQVPVCIGRVWGTNFMVPQPIRPWSMDYRLCLQTLTSVFVFYFEMEFHCAPGWPQTSEPIQLSHLSTLPSISYPACWDSRCMPPCPASLLHKGLSRGPSSLGHTSCLASCISAPSLLSVLAPALLSHSVWGFFLHGI